MSTVTYENVVKFYGSTEVIPNLNLDIHDGEFLVLVGPSGCGKTTTLRMLAGLEEVTSGKILIDSKDVTPLRPGLRNCAMVFQNYALYPHMTVRENIAYGMKVRKVKADLIDTRVKEASSLLGLDPYLDRKPRHLSGGQRQRVAIGRALVRHPQVFLFDEPLSNLDAKLRVGMRSEIRRLQKRLKTTAVYVTHDQVEAMTMADRVVVMREGHIEQVADPLTLYNEPANRFVANFIGSPSMNFFETEIEDGQVRFEGGKLSMGQEDIERLGGERRQVLFGIRPEHMVGNSDDQFIEMIPHDIEPLGQHTLILGQCGNNNVTAQVAPSFSAKIDEKCVIPINMTKAHYFDPENGLRI